MLGRIRPNILTLAIALAGICVYAQTLGQENIALTSLGGLIASIMNLQEKN